MVDVEGVKTTLKVGVWRVCMSRRKVDFSVLITIRRGIRINSVSFLNKSNLLENMNSRIYTVTNNSKSIQRVDTIKL